MYAENSQSNFPITCDRYLYYTTVHSKCSNLVTNNLNQSSRLGKKVGIYQNLKCSFLFLQQFSNNWASFKYCFIKIRIFMSFHQSYHKISVLLQNSLVGKRGGKRSPVCMVLNKEDIVIQLIVSYYIYSTTQPDCVICFSFR